MFILVFLAVWVVFALVGIAIKSGQNKKTNIEPESFQESSTFYESDAAKGLDILLMDEYEKRIIGKKIFLQELIRSIPAMLSWIVLLLLPAAIVIEKPLIFLGCIAVMILLCIMTLHFYLLHPFALLEGKFDLYGGLCHETRASEHDNFPDEHQVKINDIWLDVDVIRYKRLEKRICYYYIIQFYKGKEYMFLRTDEIVAKSRMGR